MITEQAVWKQLDELKDPMFVKELRRFLNDPTLGSPLSVVDVGLIYDVKVQDKDVHVTVAVYNRGHLMIVSLSSPVRQKILEMDGVGEVTVECVWEPEWTPDCLSQRARDVLGFEKDDPVEGRLHVRSEKKADPDAKPFDERRLERDRLVVPEDSWELVETLPKDKFVKWWGGWRFFKRFKVQERESLSRRSEPIHLDCLFDGDQLRDMAKEIRIVEEGSAEEIPCQVYAQKTDDRIKSCSIVFLADIDAGESKTYLVLYGNLSPACWTPLYRTDLIVRGEEYALEIENSYCRARLSPVMGQLRGLEFMRWGETVLSWYEEPTTINITDASNDPKSGLDIAWHGEHNCIHWNPDFSNQLRFRITHWSEPPNYKVVKGPICTIVKRWGYPVSPIYPALPQTAVTVEVTYTFYSGLPYFTMESRLDVEEEVDIAVVRNDEWLFDDSLTHTLSMIEGGKIEVSTEGQFFEQNNPALVGFFNERGKDAFASLRLSFDSRGFPGAYDPQGTGVYLRSAGQKIWSRAAFQAEDGGLAIQSGAEIGEYNAYLLYNAGEAKGHNQARDWYNLLRRPLNVTQGG